MTPDHDNPTTPARGISRHDPDWFLSQLTDLGATDLGVDGVPPAGAKQVPTAAEVPLGFRIGPVPWLVSGAGALTILLTGILYVGGSAGSASEPPQSVTDQGVNQTGALPAPGIELPTEALPEDGVGSSDRPLGGGKYRAAGVRPDGAPDPGSADGE